jgi:CRISPR-associated protein Csm5
MKPNRVYPLEITTLSPLHINSGARLLGDVDFYSDATTTYVLDSDVALELALQRWQARQPSYEEALQTWQDTITSKAQQIETSDRSLRKRIDAFEASPPRDKQKFEEGKQRLRDDHSNLIKRKRDLELLQSSPPAPPDTNLPDELLQNSGFAKLLETTLITPEDLRDNTTLDGRPLVRYRYAGKAANQDILELIKDPRDRPYLPGSSLKGAMRSALAWAYANDDAAADLENAKYQGAKSADDAIERAIFQGRDGNGPRRAQNAVLRDVLRTLHVGDSAAEAVAPELLTVQVYPKGSPITVEALPAGVTLRATLQLERYAFENAEARAVLNFDKWAQRLEPLALAKACRERGAALLADEQKFFADEQPEPELQRFYAELYERQRALDERSFLLPVGWGASWRSKTLDARLRSTPQREENFVRAVQTFNMKNNREKSKRFKAGDLFPATRKLSYQDQRPWRPLGWLHVTIGAEVTR